jgi:hypothetical protein
MQCNQVPHSSTIVRRQLRARGSMVATALLVLAWGAGTAQSRSSQTPALGPLLPPIPDAFSPVTLRAVNDSRTVGNQSHRIHVEKRAQNRILTPWALDWVSRLGVRLVWERPRHTNVGGGAEVDRVAAACVRSWIVERNRYSKLLLRLLGKLV